MTGSDTAPPPADSNQLPRHTTPTWEVELLISGAAVFAMLQLPGWLEGSLSDLAPRFSEELSGMLTVMYVYMISAAIVLAVTFALHLVLRAHWIALVGMHSVYPGGVRWNRLTLGPIQREVTRQLDPGPAASIEQADNRATVVFAFGIFMATLAFLLGVTACTALAVTMVANSLGGMHLDAFQVFIVSYLALLGPVFLLLVVDLAFGARLRPGGFPRRAVAAVYKVYWRFGVIRGYSTSNVIASHAGQRCMSLLISATLLVVIAGVFAYRTASNSSRPFGSYAMFPGFSTGSAHRVDAGHYGDRRDPERGATVPFVQSMLVTGAYLELVVPYQPGRDDAALRRDCAAAQGTDGDARAAALLGCLAQLHTVSLDGKPLPSLRYDAASDPRTGLPALHAMIDVRSLATGRHELHVARTPAPPGDDHGHDAATAYTIPFWR